MQETTEQLSATPAVDDLVASARTAGDWAGEPLLHSDEDPAQVLEPGTARRNALDEALAEIEAGNKEPSSQWKVRFALMLGLERVLSEKPPHLASGTELRRHQVDALAGMLTELIAANQRQAEEPLNGNGSANGHIEPGDARGGGRGLRRHRRGTAARGAVAGRGPRRRPPLPLPAPDRVRQDDRRRRVRRGGPDDGRPDPHPQAPPRLPVQPRARRRGLRRPADPDRRAGTDLAPTVSDHRPDVRVVRAAPRQRQPRHVPARDRRRGAHGARREDEPRDPQLPRPDLHRDDGDRAADREAGLGRLPGLGRRPPAAGRGAARPDRAAAQPPRAAGGRDPLRADRRRRLRGARARGRPRPQGSEPGRREPLPRPLRLDARASSTRPGSTTRTTSRRSSAPRVSRPRRSAGGRLRSSSPRSSPRTSVARSTS